MHISEVRTGYQKIGDNQKESVSALPSFGGKLPLPVDENQAGIRDTEPSLQPDMAAVIAERVLSGTLTAMAHDGFRTVVITATEVKDKIFLATLIRQYYPKARLLLTGGDIVLSHPNNIPALHRHIVGSTYPLYPKNQRWAFPFQHNGNQLLFPSEIDQGYYNAALALLWPDYPEDLSEYGHPFESPPPITDELGLRPPVWD